MRLSKIAFSFVLSVCLILTLYTPGKAEASSKSTAVDTGEYLLYLLKNYTKTINSGEIYDIDANYDNLSNQIKKTEKAIGKVSGASTRKALLKKYVNPAKIARERVIYEVSQYRLLKSIGKNAIANKESIVTSDLKKLDRLKRRAVEIKKAGGYQSVPSLITKQLESIELPLKNRKFAIPDPSVSFTINNYELDAFLLVNMERYEQGLQPLTLHKKLSDVARIKSNDMYVSNYFSLHSSKYGSIEDLLSRYGFTSAGTSYGVNIAKGWGSARKTISELLDSSQNREILLQSDITYTGVGVDHDHVTILHIAN
ncbi:CAP domain-containing protein [Metabacillus litoralis]|uniref:CAP domain-containing protein n=1 Tax=Metabacillus litoralis TaxID=152268 RepID=UPI00203D5989|nr:CAP domain-containing protein [Metabacillus litoralis]MCM3410080.1 CAP domain-containing protein [Metabacillus litoralis]